MMRSIMIAVHGTERVLHPITEVFDAGRCAETWPSVQGLEIKPQTDMLAIGSVIRFRLSLPKINLGVDAEVTQCDSPSFLVIEGASDLASYELNLN